MRTRAKVLTKVKVTWVREAKVTLQQLTATTNAAGMMNRLGSASCTRAVESVKGRLQPLTYSQDADQLDQRRRGGTRREEGLHHVAAESQGHVGGHGRPGDGEQV